MSNSVECEACGAGPHGGASKARIVVRAALFAAGIVLYLGATFLCLAAGWWLPGRGIDTIAARLICGCAVPAVGSLLLHKRLRRMNLAPMATALMIGMILVGLACFGGAIGLVVGFRILDE
jgi:hypothetical protein